LRPEQGLAGPSFDDDWDEKWTMNGLVTDDDGLMMDRERTVDGKT
jgi:hypothetical protein